MPSPYDDISLLPPGYSATAGYQQPTGGGLFSGLFGGGQQQYGGLLGAAGGGNTDALINQLLQRQIEAATQPDFGAFAAALGKAAQPSLLPKSIGAALGEAAGALSGNREQSLARALQSAKLMQDLQLQRRKQTMFEAMFGSGAGNDPDIAAAKDILGGAPGIPGVKPLSSTALSGGTVPAKPLIPRVPRSDETTGDLGGSYGEPSTDEAAGGDSDLTAGGDSDLTAGGGTSPAPRPQAAAGLTGSAWELANNNFGGLRKPGVVAGPSQGGFQSFATPEQGVAAISRQLDRYASGATTGTPLTTVRQIVSTWAPPNENPTEALIARASRIVGVDPDAPLDVSNPQIKARLIEATIANEQGGRVPVPRDLISRVAASQAPPTASSGQMPPPRIPAGSWLDQPVSGSGFRTPSDAPGNQGAAERLRQSVLGMLAGGSPLVDPDQSPTAAIEGGRSRAPDVVLPSGNRPTLPGLLRPVQYSGITDPDQSPAAMLGGRGAAPPPAPPIAQPPMAPGAPGPVQVPTVPTPAGMDPSRINQVLLNLARKSAAAEAAGFPNIYGPMISAIQQSPQYRAMVEHATEAAKLPFQYAQPQFNVPLQTQLETAKQTAIQLGKFLGPEYDPVVQKMLKDLDERAKAPYGTPVEVNVEMPDGTKQKIKVTPEEYADYRAGKSIPRLPHGATIVGERVYGPIETAMAGKFGTELPDRRLKAQDSSSTVEGMNQARELLDAPGGIYSGTWGPAKLALAKSLGITLGNSTKETAINTQTFLVQRAREVATEIKNFGAGTGLSDADREYAKQIAGGDIKLDEAAMRRIFNMGEKHHRRLIDNYNEDASKVSKDLSPYPLTVKEPGYYGAPPIGTIDEGKEYMGGDPAKGSSWRKVR